MVPRSTGKGGGARRDPMVGRLLSGYRVQKALAEGGMAVLYLGEPAEPSKSASEIPERVAIKVLRKTYCADASFRRRFLQEARVASRLDHPNIVSTLDVGQIEGRLYTINEFVDGPTLKVLLQRTAQRELQWCVRLLVQIASALGEIHDHGIVHRDLKPENVLMAPGGIPKLTDFGIAKDLSIRSMGVNTAGGMILGSPSYMAPEQVTGGEVGAATDLYALGVLFYELLTGEAPFSSGGKIMLRKIREPAPAPSSLRSGLPTWVDGLVLELLARNPSDRPADVSVVIERLRERIGEKGGGGDEGKLRGPLHWHWALSVVLLSAMVALNLLLWFWAR